MRNCLTVSLLALTLALVAPRPASAWHDGTCGFGFNGSFSCGFGGGGCNVGSCNFGCGGSFCGSWCSPICCGPFPGCAPSCGYGGYGGFGGYGGYPPMGCSPYASGPAYFDPVLTMHGDPGHNPYAPIPQFGGWQTTPINFIRD